MMFQTPPGDDDDSAVENDGERSSSKSEDAIMLETLKSLPVRDRKNAEYIMKKISENEEKWSSRGEFIHRRVLVKGSHMFALLRHLTQWSRKSQPPTGWKIFLHTLTELNILVSAIRNP